MASGGPASYGNAMLDDRILFIDGEAIVIDKPAGLPVDPPRDGALSVANHLARLAFGFQRWPVTVHRLDRDTSGCLILARNPKAAARFTRAFEERGVAKSYLAILDGVLADDSGTITGALAKISSAERGWRMVIAATGQRDAKPAVTHWQTVAVAGGRTLVRFRPETGRTHQLRVHAADALGHAIVGDAIYHPAGPGAKAVTTVPRQHRQRTLLHAETIMLDRQGKPPVVAHAPFPDDFAALGFAAPPCPAAVAAAIAADQLSRPAPPLGHG